LEEKERGLAAAKESEKRRKDLREREFGEAENLARNKPNILLDKLLVFWVSLCKNIISYIIVLVEFFWVDGR
jgi:hypothetical protein